jgi:hypothetical protein
MFTGIRPLASRMRSWISPRRVDQKFQQELSAHLEMLTYENIQRGMVPIEAKRAARIRLDGSHYIGQQISNLGDCSCSIHFCRTSATPRASCARIPASNHGANPRPRAQSAYRAGAAGEYVAGWFLFDRGQTMSKFIDVNRQENEDGKNYSQENTAPLPDI